MGSGIHCLAAYVTFGNVVVKSNNATGCCVFADTGVRVDPPPAVGPKFRRATLVVA